MVLLEWFPAVTTTSLLAIGLWLARNLILTRLTKSVEHEFDAKLETLRGQLGESEERLRADLRAKEAEISALRSGAMTAMASRQMAVDQRRLEAVDQLWSSVTALGPAKAILPFMAVIRFDNVASQAERDPKLRKAFGFIGSGFDFKALDLSGAAKARPFLSPVVWATYSAILAMVFHAVMRLQVLKSGAPAKDIMDDQAIAKVIKAALPHQAEFIDKYGASGYYFLVDQLESKLLQDLQAMLGGSEADKASIQQAAEILRASNEVLKQVDSGE